MSEQYVYRRRIEGILATLATSETTKPFIDQLYEGLVVDVVLDHTHHEYSDDGYNVGNIKVRIFDVHNSLDSEYLDWASPLDYNIFEMPLKGELVILHRLRGAFFYSRKASISHRIQENGMLGLNELLVDRSSKSFKNRIINKEEILTTVQKHKFGKYFRPDSRVRQLKHFEGDLIIQGRMGNSIRFGSSKMDLTSQGLAPNIILRTGQGKDIEKTNATTDTVFGLVLEDINKDASSIWMVSDQMVKFTPSTNTLGSFMRSIKNPLMNYDKASIFINSGRVVLNSKSSHILLFSNEELYLNSTKRASIDTDDSIFLTATVDIFNRSGRNIDNIVDGDFTIKAGSDITMLSLDKTSIISDKIYVGSSAGDYEPIVGGTSLSIFLGRLITILMGNPPVVARPQSPKSPIKYNMTPVVAPGTSAVAHTLFGVIPCQLHPAIVTALAALYAELAIVNDGQRKKQTFSGAPFNSRSNFVNLYNENAKAGFLKNEFAVGTQVIPKASEYKLSDTSYYKVL